MKNQLRGAPTLLRAAAPPLTLAAAFLSFLSTASFDHHQVNDAVAALIPAWHFAMTGSMDLQGWSNKVLWVQAEHGAVRSDRLPGAIFVAIPFYRLLGTPSAPTFYPAGVTVALCATLTLGAIHRLLKPVLHGRVALATAALLGFGTATWTVSADALWTHGPDQMWLSLSMLALASTCLVRAGLSSAFAIFTRPHMALVIAAQGTWAAWNQRSLRPLFVVGATSSLGIIGLLAYNWRMFGHPSILGHYGGHVAAAGAAVRSSDFLVNIAGTFFSPLRGLFLLSPFLLLLLPGLSKAWKIAPWWARSSAVGGLAYLAAQLAGNYFAGGTGFYSYRLSLETLTAATPLLAVSYTTWTQHKRWRRWAFGVLAVLSVGIHALGAFSWHEAPDVPIAAWTRYQPWIALQQASVVKLLIVAGCMVVAALVLRWCARMPESADAATADLADHREAAVLR